jgi:hypothetical protein
MWTIANIIPLKSIKKIPDPSFFLRKRRFGNPLFGNAPDLVWVLPKAIKTNYDKFTQSFSYQLERNHCILNEHDRSSFPGGSRCSR